MTWDYYCDVVAEEMGVPRKRISWRSFRKYIPEEQRESTPHIRVDFDGGREEFHLCAVPFRCEYGSAVETGKAFACLLLRAAREVEKGTWKKSAWRVF